MDVLFFCCCSPLSSLFSAVLSFLGPSTAFMIDGRTYRALGPPLGVGATCVVHRVRDSKGEEYALKEMKNYSLVDVRREVEAHLAVRHDNVLPLLCWSVEAGGSKPAAAAVAGGGGGGSSGGHQGLLPSGDEEQCRALLLFPLAQQGSVGDAIRAAMRPPGAFVGQALGEVEALRYCSGLARGLCALHASGRSHRDVNPRNALLLRRAAAPAGAGASAASAAGGGGVVAVALADLGSVAPLHTPIATRLEALRATEEAAQRTSMPYRAPELWQCDPGPQPLSGAAADVWALGCTLYACLWGASPYEVEGAAGGLLRLCEPSHNRVLGEPHFPALGGRQISEEVVRLIRQCLAQDPAQRPTMTAIEGRMEDILKRL